MNTDLDVFLKLKFGSPRPESKYIDSLPEEVIDKAYHAIGGGDRIHVPNITSKRTLVFVYLAREDFDDIVSDTITQALRDHYECQCRY